MVDVVKDKCMGCQQCADICPVRAIEYEIKNGFKYPKINDNCIGCGLCERKCPALNDLENHNKQPIVYAAWTKNDKQRLESTSGGICYELSKYIIENGGYVAGVSWDNNFRNAKYEVVNDFEGLSRITQSKYFQPDISGIYKAVKEKLDEGKKVLFIGSACTGEALRLFLDKEYPNLFCCDFICRGYTSQLFHEKRIDYLENKHKSKVVKVQYKNKNYGWKNFGTFFQFENGESEYINRYKDPYEIMFQIDDYNTRPSCFDCKYREKIRRSDLTVGDFWGIKYVDEDTLKKGISCILVHSEKGNKLFEAIKDRLVYEKRQIYEVRAGNMALRGNLNRKDGYKEFFKDLENQSYDKIAIKYAPFKGGNGMGRKIEKLKDILKCNLIDFIRINWLCSSVVRNKGKYIIPYKGTRFCIHKDAKIYIKENLFLNTQKHKNSHEEMYFTVAKNASVYINGRTTIATGSTIDVLENAKLSLGSADTNIGVVIVCSNCIEMKDDVQIGRGVMIYDSNYHKTGLNNQKNIKPLLIGQHVWLCTGVTITKGLKIGDGAICGINSTIMNNVQQCSLVMGNPAKKVMTDVEW